MKDKTLLLLWVIIYTITVFCCALDCTILLFFPHRVPRTTPGSRIIRRQVYYYKMCSVQISSAYSDQELKLQLQSVVSGVYFPSYRDDLWTFMTSSQTFSDFLAESPGMHTFSRSILPIITGTFVELGDRHLSATPKGWWGSNCSTGVNNFSNTVWIFLHLLTYVVLFYVIK